MMMPFDIKPGVNALASRLSVGNSWWQSNLIRFKDGILEKLGGWLRRTNTPLVGRCRTLLPWADLSSNQYIGCGTETNLQLWNGSEITDITPIRKTSNLTSAIATVAATKTVTIHDVANGVTLGDTVYIGSSIAVGGVILYGWYAVASIVDADHYTIQAAVPALTTDTGGGTPPAYTTDGLTNVVSVSLTLHGLRPGNTFLVYVSTAVGGLTLQGSYTVLAVIDANTFTFTASIVSTSVSTVSENTGNARVVYGIHAPTQGYVRNWWLDAWGQDLMGCYTNGPIYLWAPPIAAGNVATVISAAPAANAGMFISMPQQIVVAFGCTDPLTGHQDPMLIRWSNVGDYTDWTASATNQAGSFRLPSGSKIVGGVSASLQAYILTDTDLWTMTYIGFPYIFSFQKVGSGCGLVAPKAVSRMGSGVYWMGRKEFYRYDGSSVQPLPCPVWNFVFENMDWINADKITTAPNSEFSECSWFFPQLDFSNLEPGSFGYANFGAGNYGGIVYPGSVGQANSNENSAYVKLNVKDGPWDYGYLTRTAWFDQSIIGDPIGVDANGIIQQHEIVEDADGYDMPTTASTGWMKMSNGGEYVFLERILPDFATEGVLSVSITVNVVDYPGDAPRVYGPFAIDNTTQYAVVRARGRLVSFDLNMSGLGSFSRLGQILGVIQAAGKR